MLLDDKTITLELTKEIDLIVAEPVIRDINVDLWLDGSVRVNTTYDIPVTVDLESMAPEVDDPFSRFGKIQRVFFFVKSVLGKKTTFAQVHFDIHNNIQTVGIADIDPGNHNLVALPITFSKAVTAKKTTFGRSNFVITNNIQTAGINGIGGIRLYGSGLYGDGPYGTYYTAAILLPIRFGSIISGDIPYKQTSVGEISLASHGTPSERTHHTIKVKARTLSGSTGVLRAALYEGATNRSGDLETSLLTNTLTDYTLNILDSLAATITDYSNLSIRFWGYDSAGNALVFEIAEIYLELPIETGSVHYGIISRQIVFSKSVSGIVSSKSTAIAEISLASHDIPLERTHHTIKVRARTTSGSSGVLKAALYEGSINRSGVLITEPLTNTLTDYTLIIHDSNVALITDWTNLSIKFWGFDIAGNALVFEVSEIYLELPVSTGNTTHYGAVSRGIIFTKAVSGVVSNKKTSVAEISLASHGTPSERTHHSIKVRARTTSGSTGVIKAALYEGSTLRSGTAPLITSLLTNSLADYSLAVSDASAATITDYSNLSIKFWGHDSAGNALVFEIAKIYLELPTT
jgi:hypothetical protein